MVPEIRIARLNELDIRASGDYVLYWMIAARRTNWNFALDRAREHADALGKPIVILEALRTNYPWACERFHQFAADGMHDNHQACASRGVLYYPYLERARGEGKGLLERLAERAAVVVTDEFPCFFLPEMTAAAARKLSVRLEAVDGNGLLPLRAVNTVFPTAYAFRRAFQRVFPSHLSDRPRRDPLAGPLQPAPVLAEAVQSRWPPAGEWLAPGAMARFPVDHSIGAAAMAGGAIAGRKRLEQFLAEDFASYGIDRNQPDNEVSSRLSPYLHWGHLSVHEVFDAVTAREGWLGSLPATATGRRDGWWGLSASADSFLDELIVWRELGFNMTSRRVDYERFESLPSWALNTLKKHQADTREPLYPLATFEDARTHDPLWNAAQNQLRREGRIHNYLRMLWGKKILEWSATPREALRIMIELNNKYALDGRDPNSYSGIFWVLGRYDRPWLPERPVYGAIRYMSSDNTARKLRVRQYNPAIYRVISYRMRAATLIVAVLFCSSAQPASAQTTAFVGGRVIDGTGKVIDSGTVVIQGGRITAVGPAASTQVPAGATRVDVKGKTLLPGLVNAHGHVAATQGLQSNPSFYTRDNLVRQLKTYGQYGFTTVFSLGDDQEAGFALRDEQSKGPIDRARIFVAGPVITGDTAEAARAMTEKVAAMKPDLLKIRVDDNLGSSRRMPEPAWRAVIARGHELGYRVAVHIFYLADAMATLAGGADFIAHSVRDKDVDSAFISELKKRNACYCPTFTREISTFVYDSTPPWVTDPFFVKGVDQNIVAQLSDANRQAQFRASNGYKSGQQYKAGLEVAKRNLKTLSSQGVRIAMGTDTGPPARFQGFFEHLELEMMVEAGMTPMQVLVSATGDAAACHQKTGQIGTIAPGVAADLLILAANPLDNIRNTRSIEQVWIAGSRAF